MAIKNNLKINSRGFSIIEIAIVIMIIGIAFVSLLNLNTFSLRVLTLNKETNQAEMIAQETFEATRNFRDRTVWATNGLGTLTAGSDYYPEIVQVGATTAWNLALGTETIRAYTRKIVIDNVSRDPATDNIETTYNPANDDPESRKVTSTVAWGNRNISIISFLTNWQP